MWLLEYAQRLVLLIQVGATQGQSICCSHLYPLNSAYCEKDNRCIINLNGINISIYHLVYLKKSVFIDLRETQRLYIKKSLLNSLMSPFDT